MNLQSDDLHLVCHKILFQIRVLDWTFVLDKCPKKKRTLLNIFEGLFDDLGGKCILIFLLGSSKGLKLSWDGHKMFTKFPIYFDVYFSKRQSNWKIWSLSENPVKHKKNQPVTKVL